MNWLDKLERKYGRFAIRGLMTYIISLNALVYLLTSVLKVPVNSLILYPSLILKGEIWRLVTYIFIPPSASPIWIIFILYFYYMIGNSLEHEWGSFKFNIYYLMGMLGTTIAAFISGAGTTATYLNLSLFLAFAYIYPNYEILLFFILPIKIKYLAWLNWFYIGFTILFQPLPLKLAAIVSIINYFVFFGKDIFTGAKNRKHVYANRKKFNYDVPKKSYIHKCTVCGITEKDNPDMEFRYCSKCEGDYEYCMEHLHNHDHKHGGQLTEDRG